MSKHTPGPWEAFNGWAIRKCVSDTCCVIAELRQPYRLNVGIVRGEGEQQANARLIAAAPELLEALTAIIHDGLHCDVVPHLHEKARAAIAKATGDN